VLEFRDFRGEFKLGLAIFFLKIINYFCIWVVTNWLCTWDCGSGRIHLFLEFIEISIHLQFNPNYYDLQG
jgi:hypothetical protein